MASTETRVIALMREIYEHYIAICNAHRFDRLGELVAGNVQVDGALRGLRGYIADLEAVARVFPDFHWEIQHVVLEGEWLAAHLLDTGTQAREFRGVKAAGRRFAVREFAFYRFRGGQIAEVWARADEAGMIEQLLADLSAGPAADRGAHNRGWAPGCA